MYIKFTNALLVLLTASHTLWLTQAHPRKRPEVADDAVLVQNNDTTDGEIAAARLIRRVNGAPPQLGSRATRRNLDWVRQRAR